MIDKKLEPVGYIGIVKSNNIGIPVDALLWPWELKEDRVRSVEEPLYRGSDVRELVDERISDLKENIEACKCENAPDGAICDTCWVNRVGICDFEEFKQKITGGR